MNQSLFNIQDVIILPENHISLYPVGQDDQISINLMKRGSRRRPKQPTAVWLQPQTLVVAPVTRARIA